MAKILLVDDDPDITESLTLILEGNGHQVSAVDNTDDIVGTVRRHNPDLVLLDVIFPQDPQAGFKAARALALDQDVNHIPVLVLSAVNQQSDLGFSFSDKDISDDFMPVTGFIEKPVEPAVLLARIDSALRGA
ncbi:MAG: response regulator [Chromatiales bacterium]|jgi:CheY-like chemotaxis protein|nr:response regulator [Chromatiales bacterium]MDX9766598.1 response regulator [Ectothiorhodospiraceae bacterium]